MRSCWWVNPDKSISVQRQFASLDELDMQDASAVTKSPLSQLVLKTIDATDYYVKIYHRPGRKLRRFMGRSRLRAEWENLFLFASLGIPIPEIIAFGEQRCCWHYSGGVLVTQSLSKVRDLASLADENHPFLQDSQWLQQVLKQVVKHTRALHNIGFIHNDLKWRNILVSLESQPTVYFIDCPTGKRKRGWFKRRGIIKDLACLDKVAKKYLSNKMRLHFVKSYLGVTKLNHNQKLWLQKILVFFAGRE